MDSLVWGLIAFIPILVVAIQVLYNYYKAGMMPYRYDPCPFIDECKQAVTEVRFREVCLRGRHRDCEFFQSLVYSKMEKKTPREWKEEAED